MSIALPPSLAARIDGADIVAVGEPTHGADEFPAARNDLFRVLVERGFRSIACETDAIAALGVDAFVAGGPGELDGVVATGFSHGFGDLPANRELVAWMRAENANRSPDDRLAFHGVDLPVEATGAPSPRRFLTALLDHLGAAADHLQELLGDDARWSDPAATWDASRSVGASADAAALRAAVDDLMAVLARRRPDGAARRSDGSSAMSPAAWYDADLHGRTARGLLRYHAAAAIPGDPEDRMARLLEVRDAVMAENVLAMRQRERRRGPTLLFAHNRHLQRHPTTWTGAGEILAAQCGERYVFVAGGLGESPRLGLGAPPDGSIEAHLDARAAGHVVLLDPPAPGTARPARPGYSALDPATVEHADAVLHVPVARHDGVPLDDVAARITALPDVTVVLGEEPESMRGARFFFTGTGRTMPFATIVERDTPGGDEESQLHRPGVYRLSVALGRAAFERAFGFPPAKLAEIRDRIDFARLDQLLPHPVYGRQGWAQILSPKAARLTEIDRLVLDSYNRSVVR